jgi:hypothetical protein
VLLDFFDDVFLLNLTFESPQGILNGFAILNPYFGQSIHPHSTSTINRETSDYSAVLDFSECYTSALMARCPLCSDRSGKRFCPAKVEQICAVCCGTKREVEIDCPSSCPHLIAGRSYEAEKRIPDPELVQKVERYSNDFVYRYSPILDAISQSVVQERLQSPWLVDNDVVEVYKSLSATMKTLSSGIYYETLPDGPVRISLFRRVKVKLDELMQPSAEAERRTLKVSEAVDVLDFLTVAAQTSSSTRPKSRRYLDWLSQMAGLPPAAEQPSGLILP